MCSHNFKRSFLHSFYLRWLVENYTHLIHEHIHTLYVFVCVCVNVGELLSKDKSSRVFSHAFIVLYTAHSINFEIHVRTHTQRHSYTYKYTYTFIVPNEKPYLSSKVVFVGWVLANIIFLTHSLTHSFTLSFLSVFRLFYSFSYSTYY